MRTSILIRSVYLFFVLCMLACNNASIYKSKISIKDQWTYDDVLQFDIHIVDTNTHYDLNCQIEHQPDFAYQNIYIKIITHFPDSSNMIDEISLELTDKKGNWLGKCNKKKCRLQISLQERFRFRNIGVHSFHIANHSRKELEGVSAIGLSLEESDIAPE